MNEQAFLEAKIAGLENEVRNLKATLRDEFAKAALTGLLAKHGDAGWCESGEVTSIPGAAETVYEYADAMLEARKS